MKNTRRIKSVIKDRMDIMRHRNEISRLIKIINNLSMKVNEVDAKIVFVSVPNVNRLTSLTDAQLSRIQTWTFDFNNISLQDAKLIHSLYNDDVSDEYIKQIYDGVKVFEQNGCHYLSDFTSQYVNIMNGHRLTVNQPDAFDDSVYIYGSCTARGTGVEDSMTIESFMQKLCNEKFGSKYRIENCGVGCGSYLEDDFRHIEETKIGSGDIVIVLEPFKAWEIFAIKIARASYFDLSEDFNKNPINEEWFLDYTGHTLPAGNRHIAKFIFDRLVKMGLLTSETSHEKVYTQITEKYVENEELKAYLRQIKELDRGTKLNGAIVMNCNPFTLGHRYLIENASRTVDTLYIFVVEENRSFFSFEDRIELVKKGCADLGNVVVLPSGKFIISASTFPGYFNKDYDNTIKVDTSEDVSIFGRYIAKELNISKRFVGEEPLDPVTNQYNLSMKKILPLFGIELIEIPRKELGSKVISASRVREYLKNKDFDAIKAIVPASTYEYLKERYKDE